MDELAGGGGGGGQGMPAPPRPQQGPGGNLSLPPPGANGAPGGGGPAAAEAAGPPAGPELSRPQQYTIPGILHYIQHEWARFEMERAHWEVERAELQVPEETKDSEAPAAPQNSQLTWKQGRQLLRQYLQEVGYTDTILDVRSQRVRSLLGLSNSEPNGSVEAKNLEQILNGGESPKQKGQEIKRPSGDVLETFNFLENADDSDEEENDMIEGIPEGKDKLRINKHKLPANKDAFRKTWNPKYTLRSHFDGVRALAFHPVEPVLVTASEDHTLKLWNLQKTVPAKKSASLDVEPIYTFRAHIGPVLSLAISSNGEQCFSGGIDATIQWWNMPSPNVDPYDTYESNVLAGTLVAHTDAVWGLAYSGIKNQLLSCSADGTIRLWNPQEKLPCICTYNGDKEHGIPTSVDFIGCDPAHMVTSFNTGSAVIYDLETSQSLVMLSSQVDSGLQSSCHINRVVSHPTLPVTITAHEDRHIKFFDNKTGKMIHSMVAHLDAVTSLAVDPNGIYLMSGSHDCSIRLWNLDSKTCVQEITAHRKKLDESIYDVAFHPSKAYIASAGADALAKVFV
ncbi:Strn3 [Phodopus roborovskii]|uniref:Strn3 protein n=1 Tax=Phodopus roborovskii TaxID=109678 RepID=A0AAU9ZQ64_PHORO|nr:Strn3 [Phodopus roborovskii]